MKCRSIFGIVGLVFCIHWAAAQSAGSLTAYLSYPEPAGLTSAGSKLAWTFNEQGRRNIFVAEAPGYTYRQLTRYSEDDGQEITNLSVSPDGRWVVYVRGGDHGGNWSAAVTVNPTSAFVVPQVEIWSVPFAGGDPILLGAGSYPEISPNGRDVAFLRGGQVWVVPINGSKKAKKLFSVGGTARQIEWSPSGNQLVFVASRDTHSFIGIYKTAATAVRWISPSFSKDLNPTWSPDEKSIVFIRLPGETNKKDSILKRKHDPWEIRVADVTSGLSERLWKAPETLAGSIPTTHGRYNLNWVAHNRIVFLSYHDGWPHLYSMPASGGDPLLLTPGDFMIEELQVSADRKNLIFSANTGTDPQTDIDRRHIATVSVDRANMKMLTSGTGVESMPVYLEGGQAIAFLSSTPTRPALPARMKAGQASFDLIAEDRIPKSLSQSDWVVPQQIKFKAPDGMTVHGQLFEKKDGKKNKPALVFIHGGPQRQMFLAWDHRGYYAHTYALNQYLADQGFVVLSVNYRMGIGYGYEFHKPESAGRYGVSEYQDIKAAGEWLARVQQVDPDRIGIYGGSYGGYLTAMALGRDSELFAAGVDIHGVHTRVPAERYTNVYEQAPDAAEADRVAWESSPIAYVDTWKSPVLIIHADEDRNVGFAHSVDLVQRLEEKGVDYETLVIPDDTHHWMLHKNLLKISEATVDFFNKRLK